MIARISTSQRHILVLVPVDIARSSSTIRCDDQTQQMSECLPVMCNAFEMYWNPLWPFRVGYESICGESATKPTVHTTDHNIHLSLYRTHGNEQYQDSIAVNSVTCLFRRYRRVYPGLSGARQRLQPTKTFLWNFPSALVPELYLVIMIEASSEPGHAAAPPCEEKDVLIEWRKKLPAMVSLGVA